MSPATTSAMSARVGGSAARPGREPGERSPVGDGVPGEHDVSAEVAPAASGTGSSGPTTTTTGLATSATARSACSRTGRPARSAASLLPPNRGRCAAGEHDRRPASRARLPAVVDAASRRGRGGAGLQPGDRLRARGRARHPSGAGARAGRGPRGSPARTAGWCRSRRGRRRATAAPTAAIASAWRTRSRYVPAAQARSSSRRTMRPAASRARTPSGGQPASRAAAASDGGAATDSASSSRSIAASVAGGRPARRAGSRSRSPSRASVPSATSRSTTARATSSAAARPSVTRRRAARASPARKAGSGQPRRLGLRGVVRRDELQGHRLAAPPRRPGPAASRPARAARRAGRAVRPRPPPRPRRGRAPRRHRRGEGRRPLRREPPSRDAARRRRVQDHAAARRRPGRRPAQREPVPGRGGDLPVQAQDRQDANRRAGRSPRAARARRAPPACAVPTWRRSRSRSAGRRPAVRAARSRARSAGPRAPARPGGRIATRTRDVATTAASVVRTWPRRSVAGLDARRPAAPSGRPPTPGPSRRAPGPRARGPRRRPGGAAASSPAPRAPPRRLPVTTVPRPLTANDPVDGEPRHRRPPRARGAPRTRSRSATSAAAQRPRARRRSPRSPRTTGAPASRVRADQRGDLGRHLGDPVGVDQVRLRDRDHARRAIPIASSSSRCSSVWAFGPSSAATTSSAASISPAPTSMLPTSRSWPGTSTKSRTDPSGSARCAYPTSIVMPRRRSSGSRSASMPVRARRSVVLPWSMWPAVPTTTLIRAPGVTPAAGRCPRSGARSSRRGTRGTVRRSNTTSPSSTRARIRSGPRRRAAAARDGEAAGTATPNDGSAWPGREPPPTGDRSSTTRDVGAGRRPDEQEPRIHSARARSSAGSRAIVRQTGMSSARAPGPVDRERRGHPGEDRLVGADRAGERVAPHPGDQVRAGRRSAPPAARPPACRR